MDNPRSPTARWVTLFAGVIATMKQVRTTRVDMTRRYALSDGTRVISRSPGSVQIGTEEPRCVLVRDAPHDAADVLAALDGVTPLAQVLTAHDADPLLWSTLLNQLLANELLIPVDHHDREHAPAVPGAHLTDEQSGLRHRHGHAASARIIQSRQDALVVLRGNGVLVAPVATLLAASGVGHIHHERHPARSWSAAASSGSADAGGPGRHPAHTAELLRDFPAVRVHAPAAHQPPTAVLLAGDPLPDLGVAATLVRSRVPHLAVTAGLARSVVGPLVLPGRSSCLSCAHRRRTEADPEWPAVVRQLAHSRPHAPAFLVSVAACLAAGQLLDHIDGAAIPTTVNGTLEWRAGDVSPRRRTWPPHPECGCQTLPEGR